MAIISGNHPESAGIRSCKACLPPGNAPRLMRKAISGNLEASPHQWQSVAISGNQWQSGSVSPLEISKDVGCNAARVGDDDDGSLVHECL